MKKVLSLMVVFVVMMMSTFAVAGPPHNCVVNTSDSEFSARFDVVSLHCVNGTVMNVEDLYTFFTKENHICTVIKINGEPEKYDHVGLACSKGTISDYADKATMYVGENKIKKRATLKMI